MKTSKRILIIVSFIVLTSIASGCLSIPAFYFGYNFWWSFVFWTGLQMVGYYWKEQYLEIEILEKTKEEVLAKPFREYIISLPCQSCNQENEVVTDLSKLSFRCTRCKRKNAVHVTYQSAIQMDDVAPGMETFQQLRNASNE